MQKNIMFRRFYKSCSCPILADQVVPNVVIMSIF